MSDNHLRLVGAPPPNPDAAREAFMKQLYNPAVVASVNETIGALFSTKPYQGEPLPKRVHLNRELEKGTIHPVRISRGRTSSNYVIATSVQFPEWLAEQTEFSSSEAQQLAAVYVNSFALIYSTLVNHPGRNSSPHAGSSPLDQELWEGYHDISPVASTPYRAAACVALRAFDTKPISHPDRPQPAHVAGLIQPLSPAEFRTFHAILK